MSEKVNEREILLCARRVKFFGEKKKKKIKIVLRRVAWESFVIKYFSISQISLSFFFQQKETSQNFGNIVEIKERKGKKIIFA